MPILQIQLTLRMAVPAILWRAISANVGREIIRDVLFEASMNASPDKPIYYRYALGKDTMLSVYPAP